MNARDRGALIMRLAELMDENKEELATIESIGINTQTIFQIHSRIQQRCTILMSGCYGF